jgi:cAMP-dependent protein kinase regulator
VDKSEEEGAAGSENETDEDVSYPLSLMFIQQCEDDYVDDLPDLKSKAKKGPRNSVSAEAFGDWNKKSDFKARQIDKNEETEQAICNRLSQSFLFNSLSKEEFSIVVAAMEPKRYKQGESVILQGEDGAELFVVESGSLSCYKRFGGAATETFLKKYEAGDSFGELALLYNAPRAATIKADNDSLLWCLDRATFNFIVKDSSRRRREKYEGFLSIVKILKGMEPYERSVLSDAFVEETYKAGEYIIKVGEEGNKFYLVEEGELTATKVLDGDEELKEVMSYKAGDYFGERALLKNEPRAANVITKTDCLIVAIDRHSFKRLMGPLDDIMRRNMDIYDTF